MKKFISTLLLTTLLSTSFLSAQEHYDEDFSPKVEKILFDLERVGDDDKLYIDEDEMKSGDEAFYVHLGNNVWIYTNSVNKDQKGLFIYRASIARNIERNMSGFEKKWKCPYCFNFWPMGQACGNKDCPSKYR